MALQNTSNVETRSFDKDLKKDLNDFHLPPNTWTHARNAINNSKTGDLGKLGNEPSNTACAIDPITLQSLVPYTIIGIIHITGNIYAIFSTDGDQPDDINSPSEIGLFDQDTCIYVEAVNDNCLNFNKQNLIIGVSRSTGTCTYKLYWDDGRRNPSRVLEITIEPLTGNTYNQPNTPVPWKQNCNVIDTCRICINKDELDCDAIRLEPFIQVPCFNINNGVGAGTLLNGSYFVCIAYATSGQRISDWFSSNIQSIFHHDNSSGSIDVNLLSVDTDFDEILVAIVSIINQQTVVRLAGTYSTHLQRLSFDMIDDKWISIPIEQIPLMTPIPDASDVMFQVNNYLLRCGPTSKEDFNYQPLANQIVTLWQSVEYETDYYYKGGNKTNYLRDEIYSFFIQWLFDTGDKSSSYHIPGRPVSNGNDERSLYIDTATHDELLLNTNIKYWVFNTATLTAEPHTNVGDGQGIVIAEGLMGYWESSENYPDDKPQVWNSYSNPISGFNISTSPYNGTPLNEYDLCGKPIRHHRFPEQNLCEQLNYSDIDNKHIRIMGIKFKNIKYPMMNDGITPVKGIVGYEILRGSRNGNKTILAKGIVNNMRIYYPERIGKDQHEDITRPILYPNYPYNDLNADPFLSHKQTNFGPLGKQPPDPLTEVSFNKFTFHSPDTNFTNPYLNAKELKIYQEYSGNVTGKYEYSEEHPKEKLLSNFAFILSALVGVGGAVYAMQGKSTTSYVPPTHPGYSMVMAGTSIGSSPDPFTFAAALAGITTFTVGDALYNTYLQSGGKILGTIGGFQEGDVTNPQYLAFKSAMDILGAIPDMNSPQYTTTYEGTQWSSMPWWLRTITGVPMFLNYFTQSTDAILKLLESVTQFRQYALRYHSHCFYNTYDNDISYNLRRRDIVNQQYIGPQMTSFPPHPTETDHRKINNLYRIRTIALETYSDITVPKKEHTYILATEPLNLRKDGESSNPLKNPISSSFDNTTEYISGIIKQNAYSFYVGLKQRINNLYGQINGVQQVPVSYCPQAAPVFNDRLQTYDTTESGVTFGGDTYLGRYTEKNTFYYFYDWLYGQPDGSQFDYTKHKMVPHPTFWTNFDKFETSEFTQSVWNVLSSLITDGLNFDAGGLQTPTDHHYLDGEDTGSSWDMLRMGITNAWFYLFNSGVRDFYVESDYNVTQRDWGNKESEEFYNPYAGSTDTKDMFRTDLIKNGNYYKYDQSLSISKLFINYVSWAAAQGREYDPFSAETCFTYYPKRIIYSLPSQLESKQDNWTIFLANNYKDFISQVTAIKPVSKSGAAIFFQNESPVMFQGLDQLQTSSGSKLTIGDGGLFTQPMQNIVNVDRPIEYGSCQNRLSVINTPAGLFWMSQNQGKIFNYQGNMNELTAQDLRWWFSNYLPYKLTLEFPNFELTDNPVIGIGCQAIYDNENGLVYFCKRDYIVRRDLVNTIVEYISGNHFKITDTIHDISTIVDLGNPLYFEDASWTVSYDPKIKGWVSWHDWHPNLLIPSKNTFMSILDRGIWLHNEVCDSYCKFYGIDYPFEVEYAVATGQTVNVLRSVEYLMEGYKYNPDNCYDRFHVLDHNFDEAIIHNTEQTSGVLRLHMDPKNDPWAKLNFPAIHPDRIDILCSKVEQRYRFNQFWDITDDRGEYNPNATRMIWDTSPNGYVKTLNLFNLNYNKESFQRKKFRHYINHVFFRKVISGNKKMLVMLTNNKNIISPR